MVHARTAGEHDEGTGICLVFANAGFEALHFFIGTGCVCAEVIKDSLASPLSRDGDPESKR